ncbi:MAG: hypothetical protein ACO3R6_13395, partial [Lutimaribacter sp.]
PVTPGVAGSSPVNRATFILAMRHGLKPRQISGAFAVFNAGAAGGQPGALMGAADGAGHEKTAHGRLLICANRAGLGCVV